MDNKLKQLIEAERMKYSGAVPQNFSKHLARLRKASNLSQIAFAEKLGIPPSTYANWEQGRREPKIFDLFNIMYVLDIDYEEFFDIT